jgi:hypothetical protein
VQTDPPTRAGNSGRLTVLSQAERNALYGLPDFDDFQRADFFAFTEAERAVADRRKGPVERLHCLLQIGYFKAKQAFFNFDGRDIPMEDIEFLLKRYFPGDPVALRPLRRNERYAQRAEIAELFGYRLWSAADRPATGGGRRPGSAAFCCSMSTRRSMTRRRSEKSGNGRSRSCRKMTFLPPAIVCAKDRTVKWNCAGAPSIGRRGGSQGTCVRLR